MARTSTAVKAEIKELRGQYEAIIAKNDPAHDEELRAMDHTFEKLTAEYSERAQDEQRVKNNREAMDAIFAGDAAPAPPTGDGNRTPDAQKQYATLGERFVNAPEFKAWHNSLTAGGTKQISENMGVRSPVVDMPVGLDQYSAILTGLSSTSGGALVVNDRTNILVPAIRDALRVTDLLTRMTTTSDVVEFVRVGTETNAATGVLEATTISDGAKPESTTALAVASEIVETIAHITYITRRAAADAGQIMAYVNDFLMWGLMDALNDEIINGTGTTPHLRGLDDLSGHQTQAFATDMLTTTRKGRTLVKTVGGAVPTAFLLTPENWEAIDLLQDNEKRYYFGGPMGLGQPVLWGLPVIEEEALDANLAFVGDWRQGIIFDREQARIYMTDSNRDLFERNILTLLAEMRAAVAWLRPAAFVEMAMA